MTATPAQDAAGHVTERMKGHCYRAPQLPVKNQHAQRTQKLRLTRPELQWITGILETRMALWQARAPLWGSDSGVDHNSKFTVANALFNK